MNDRRPCLITCRRTTQWTQSMQSSFLMNLIRLWCTASLVMGVLAATPALSAETPCAWPAIVGDGWEVSTPESSGFDAKALCATLANIATAKDNIHSVIVERHGRLAARASASNRHGHYAWPFSARLS